MSVGPSRRTTVRKVAAAVALTPPVLVMAASCTRWRQPTRPPVTTSPPPTSPGVTTGPSSGSNGTFAGPVVRHTYGPVQVTVTIGGGRITNVTSTGPKDNPVSSLINANALPKLDAEVLAAQSANIKAVSGATLTSPAYMRSLQGALDKAGFKG